MNAKTDHVHAVNHPRASYLDPVRLMEVQGVEPHGEASASGVAHPVGALLRDHGQFLVSRIVAKSSPGYAGSRRRRRPATAGSRLPG